MRPSTVSEGGLQHARAEATEAVQNGPQCSGLCPSGKMCPGATREPLPCIAGGYCAGSNPGATPCPERTFSNAIGLSSADQCTACPEGSACREGYSPPPRLAGLARLARLAKLTFFSFSRPFTQNLFWGSGPRWPMTARSS